MKLSKEHKKGSTVLRSLFFIFMISWITLLPSCLVVAHDHEHHPHPHMHHHHDEVIIEHR